MVPAVFAVLVITQIIALANDSNWPWLILAVAAGVFIGACIIDALRTNVRPSRTRK